MNDSENFNAVLNRTVKDEMLREPADWLEAGLHKWIAEVFAADPHVGLSGNERDGAVDRRRKRNAISMVAFTIRYSA
jgi:uncharacterized protein (DUF2267 family)